MTLTKTTWNNLNGFNLSNERISLFVTPDVGGRILSFQLDGVEAFFSLPDLAQNKTDFKSVSDVRTKKQEWGWMHYGGYKTWLAPQYKWTDEFPFLDLDSGLYTATVKNNSEINLVSPVCRETGMQFFRNISFNETGNIQVEQGITNHNKENVEWSLWDVTQLRGPGKVILPINSNSQFPYGIKSYFSDEEPSVAIDPFVKKTDHCAIVDCQETSTFKFGTDAHEGWILSLIDGKKDQWLAYLKCFDPDPKGNYPDQADVEVFDSEEHPYFEAEVLSPIQKLKPNESYSMKETWIAGWIPKSADAKYFREWIQKQKDDNANPQHKPKGVQL